MIYLDNAATGGFKPRAVYESMETVAKYLAANPGRSGHRLAITGAKIVSAAREKAAETFGCSPDRVIFTKNCTEALNIAILGSVTRGCHVITTVYEHNSVLRPLTRLQNIGLITFDAVAPEKDKPLAAAIEEKIKENTTLIVLNAVSNVTGEETDVTGIGNIAEKHGIKFIVDGAQAGGHIPVNLKRQKISALALAGHKGLYGVMGSGLLLIDDDTEITPVFTGGTGTESFNLNQPLSYPERLESGTLNLPAIAALKEGIDYAAKNVVNFGDALFSATEKVITGLSEIEKVICYSEPNRAGIVSFAIRNMPSAEVADVLNDEYDVAVRSGLHCAPLMHKFLHTEKEGLVRASLSVQNSAGELKSFISAVQKISKY